MKALTRQLRKEAKSRLRPGVGDVLLGTRPLGYAWRRLSLPMARAMMMSALQMFEAILLVLFLDPVFFIPILSLRVLAAIFGSAMWGVSESLRVELRALRAGPGRDAMRARLEVALGRSLVIAAGLVVTTATYLWFWPLLGMWSVVDAFALALAIRMGLGLVGRTLQSGPGCTRRVYRPSWSLLVPEFLDSVSLVVFWWWLGPWAVAASAIFAGVLQGTLGAWYAWRAMADDPIRPQRVRWARPDRVLLHRVIAYSVVGLTLTLPSAAVLGLLRGEVPLSLMIVLYAIRPVGDLVQDIPRLYLIDTLRVSGLGPAPRRMLGQHVLTVTIAGVVLFAMWAVLGWGLGPRGAPVLPFAFFVAFILVCGLFSITVVPPLIAGRVGAVLRGGVIAAVPVLLAGMLQLPPSLTLLVSSLGALSAAALLSRYLDDGPPQPGGRDLLDLMTLLSRLRRASGRVSLIETRLPFEARRAAHVARALSQESWCVVARLGRRHALVWEAEDVGPHRLLARCAGLAEVCAVATGDGLGTRILEWSSQSRVPEDLRTLLARPHMAWEDVEETLRRQVPGVVFRPGPGRLRGKVGTTFAVFPRLLALARAGRSAPAAPFADIDVALWCSADGVERFVVMPRQLPGAERARVREVVWKASMRRALG